MRIKDIIDNKKTVLSLEVFPPKQNAVYDSVLSAVKEIAALGPDFMSVTYGAGGGTSKNTVKIALDIQDGAGIPALAHLSCVSSTKTEIETILSEIKENGIENILALRGDIPKDNPDFPNPMHYLFASDLISQIRRTGDFCIGGACYPEGHPESPSLDEDISRLKEKVDKGCDFLITQLFFDNTMLYSFMERAQKAGINVPVLAGIMPIGRAGQVRRMCELSGASLTGGIEKAMEKYENDDESLAEFGIEYASGQINDLLSNGIKGTHIYTMNKPRTAEAILRNIV